jgi:hypothetical protein
MRNRIQMVLVLAGLVFLSGCGLVGSYELGGEQMLTLDQAIARAADTRDLWVLLSQASQLDRPNDKVIIEQELLSVSSNSQDIGTLESLSRCALSEEIRKAAAEALREHEQVEKEAEQRREEQRAQAQKEVQKQAEEIHLTRKEAMQRLIREAGGTLDDKSAEEVKRLVDRWRAFYPLCFGPPLTLPEYGELLRDLIDKLEQLRATNNFYKAFGQPLRKQFIGGSNGVFSSPSYYYFYYRCRDGTVQMRIDGQELSGDNPMVFVSELNVL